MLPSDIVKESEQEARLYDLEDVELLVKDFRSTSLSLLQSVEEKIETTKTRLIEDNGCEGTTRDGWCCAKHKFAIQALDDLSAFISEEIERIKNRDN